MPVDISEMLKGIDAADEAVRAAAVGGVNQITEAVLGRSKELCPVSPTNPTIESPATGETIKNPRYTGTSGALRDSGTAEAATIEDKEVKAEIGFNTKYAAAVHEILDANHNYPGAVNPQAQAKYMETAMNEFRPKFEPFIGEHIRGAVQGGGE